MTQHLKQPVLVNTAVPSAATPENRKFARPMVKFTG